MAGIDSAGLGEVLQSVLASFPDNDKGRLAKVIILPSITCTIFNITTSHRTSSSQEHHPRFLDSYLVCKAHCDLFYPRRCRLRLAVHSILQLMLGGVWQISPTQVDSSMLVSRRRNTRSGAERGLRDGGAETGIQALSDVCVKRAVYLGFIWCPLHDALHIIMFSETWMPNLQRCQTMEAKKGERYMKHSQPARGPNEKWHGRQMHIVIVNREGSEMSMNNILKVSG